MKLPSNSVQIDFLTDSIRLSIKMVHQKWISALLFCIILILVLLLLIGLGYFNLLQLIGPGALFLTGIWLFFIYRIAKVACWHRYGQEDYMIADLAFSHQRSYGIYTSEIKSVTDVGYQIRFQETTEPNLPEIERKGLLIFYTINSITKLDSILFESALEISLKEFENILYHFQAIRNQDDISINYIFLN